jgi:2-polyprenyl-3-methyl-5-hydroxy-6-metoxy-1,4-benzoquinol methylase
MNNVVTPKCRYCETALENTFLDLGLSPISNAYVKAEDSNHGEMFYPLHARVCGKCLLIQIDDCGSPEKHFHDNYAYFSSYSTSWVEHARHYVEKMVREQNLNASSQVIEVASNDGYLLQHFVGKGIPCLGVEPSANVAREAEKKGVRSWVRFFGVETAEELKKQGLQADLLLGNNVVAHVPRINDFVAGLKVALKKTGLITLEFPHLLRQIVGNQFDTIYHEHFSYFSLMTLANIFERHGLKIFDVEELSTHGGSLRIYARHQETAPQLTANYQHVLQEERKLGLDRLETYQKFSAATMRVRAQFTEFLFQEKAKGKKIVAYGAPAKGNTFLNYCGHARSQIRPTKNWERFVRDQNPFHLALTQRLGPTLFDRGHGNYLVVAGGSRFGRKAHEGPAHTSLSFAVAPARADFL